MVRRWNAEDRLVSVSGGRASYLVVHENANRGWRAELHGRPLVPARLDGWQQAWVLPEGAAGDVRLTFGPGRLFHGFDRLQRLDLIGHQQYHRVLRQHSLLELLTLAEDVDLRGRGGAAFPFARKVKAVAAAARSPAAAGASSPASTAVNFDGAAARFASAAPATAPPATACPPAGVQPFAPYCCAYQRTSLTYQSARLYANRALRTSPGAPDATC